MALRGRCGCGNFHIHWQTVDFSLVPRACGCDFCQPRNVAYTSKSGTTFTVKISNRSLHRVDTHGSGQAQFHSCAHCGDVVCVTATLDAELFGALNARLLVYPQNKPQNKPQNRARGMPDPVSMDYSEDDASTKAERWAANWCSPVRIESVE